MWGGLGLTGSGLWNKGSRSGGLCKAQQPRDVIMVARFCTFTSKSDLMDIQLQTTSYVQ